VDDRIVSVGGRPAVWAGGLHSSVHTWLHPHLPQAGPPPHSQDRAPSRGAGLPAAPIPNSRDLPPARALLVSYPGISSFFKVCTRVSFIGLCAPEGFRARSRSPNFLTGLGMEFGGVRFDCFPDSLF
jgi:hypothetical protein